MSHKFNHFPFLIMPSISTLDVGVAKKIPPHMLVLIWRATDAKINIGIWSNSNMPVLLGLTEKSQRKGSKLWTY